MTTFFLLRAENVAIVKRVRQVENYHRQNQNYFNVHHRLQISD